MMIGEIEREYLETVEREQTRLRDNKIFQETMKKIEEMRKQGIIKRPQYDVCTNDFLGRRFLRNFKNMS